MFWKKKWERKLWFLFTDSSFRIPGCRASEVLLGPKKSAATEQTGQAKLVSSISIVLDCLSFCTAIGPEATGTWGHDKVYTDCGNDKIGEEGGGVILNVFDLYRKQVFDYSSNSHNKCVQIDSLLTFTCAAGLARKSLEYELGKPSQTWRSQHAISGWIVKTVVNEPSRWPQTV